jgi:hypothetical protein
MTMPKKKSRKHRKGRDIIVDGTSYRYVATSSGRATIYRDGKVFMPEDDCNPCSPGDMSNLIRAIASKGHTPGMAWEQGMSPNGEREVAYSLERLKRSLEGATA